MIMKMITDTIILLSFKIRCVFLGILLPDSTRNKYLKTEYMTIGNVIKSPLKSEKNMYSEYDVIRSVVDIIINSFVIFGV